MSIHLVLIVYQIAEHILSQTAGEKWRKHNLITVLMLNPY